MPAPLVRLPHAHPACCAQTVMPLGKWSVGVPMAKGLKRIMAKVRWAVAGAPPAGSAPGDAHGLFVVCPLPWSCKLEPGVVEREPQPAGSPCVLQAVTPCCVHLQIPIIGWAYVKGCNREDRASGEASAAVACRHAQPAWALLPKRRKACKACSLVLWPELVQPLASC
jgi:hypothetical protein